MLSIKAIKSSGGTAKYFTQADYYTDEKGGGVSSNWFGAGAETLGLKGNVDREQLKALLDGKLPNGTELGRTGKDGKIEHQKGWDLTLSAPKTVSIMALVAKDERVLKAHSDAVAATLGIIQDKLSITRQMVDGKIKHVKTGSLTAAQFQHSTSRALDPQLHTHNLLLNATERADGSWASLESVGFYKNSKLLGTVYQNELARRVKEIGYAIEVNPKRGTFEIVGIPEAVKEAFSKRRKEVEAAIKEHGYSTPKGFDDAAVRSRSSKKEMSEVGLAELWRSELEGLGYTPAQLIAETGRQAEKPAVELDPATTPPRMPAPEATNSSGGEEGRPYPDTPRGEEKDKVRPTLTAPEKKPAAGANNGNNEEDKRPSPPRPGAQEKDNLPPTQSATGTANALRDVDFAYRNLAEREAVFTRENLMTKTLAWGLGTHTITDIESAIDHLETSGALRKAHYGKEKEEALTTKHAVDVETRILKSMRAGNGAVKPIASTKYVNEVFERTGLNSGQREAAALILTSKNKVVGVQGLAGTGKTYMLDTVRSVAESKRFKLRGLAPTGTAAEQLQNDAGIQSQTLASLLHALRAGKDDVQKRELWVLDEGSLVNSEDMTELLDFAHDKGARLALIGDTKQIGAIDWGKPFYQMINGGMETAEMNEIRRQSESPALLAAVYDSVDKRPDKALSKIKDTVYSIEDTKARVNAIVDHYLRLPSSERDDMLVLIPDNVTRTAVNQQIQERLIAEGVVDKNTADFKILVPEGLTNTEKSASRFYEKNSYVQFGKDYRSLGVERNEYLKIVDKKGDVLVLQRGNGQSIEWNPSQIAGGKDRGVETFREEERKIGVGDLVRWKRTDKDRGLKNGYMGKVSKINGDNVTIDFKNTQSHELNLKENRNWDLGYATTIFSAQGATYKNVIVHAESWRRNLINMKTFYVGISRAKKDAFVYTDDAVKLGIETKIRDGEKTSALEGAGIDIRKFLDGQGQIKDPRSSSIKEAITRVKEKGAEIAKTVFRNGMDI